MERRKGIREHCPCTSGEGRIDAEHVHTGKRTEWWCTSILWLVLQCPTHAQAIRKWHSHATLQVVCCSSKSRGLGVCSFVEQSSLASFDVRALQLDEWCLMFYGARAKCGQRAPVTWYDVSDDQWLLMIGWYEVVKEPKINLLYRDVKTYLIKIMTWVDGAVYGYAMHEKWSRF